MRKPILLMALGLLACRSTEVVLPPLGTPSTTPVATSPPLPGPPGRDLSPLDDWRPWIVPARAERTFGPIEWLEGVENGLAVANERDRPLLLWIMSADPLSCDCPGELPGRRGNLGAPGVAQLMDEFVAATDIVWRMQTSGAPAVRCFRRDLDAPPSAGLYALAANGRPLARTHTLHVDDLVEMLSEALEAWFELSPAARRPAAEDGVPWWKARRPDGGLVLTAWSRDLPPDDDLGAARPKAFGRDQVWVGTLEARALVPGPAVVGARADASREVARKLARSTFVDAVQGGVAPFTDEQVERARLFSEVVAVEEGVVRLLLWGETRAVAPGVDGPRGVETTLLGRATFEPGPARFTSFELLARGTRWGRSPTNARRSQEAPSPIGFLLEPTIDESLRRAAPRAVIEGL